MTPETTKPVKTLADVYREQGKCERGCGHKASHVALGRSAGDTDIKGAGYSNASPGSWDQIADRIRANRSTPAPSPESPRVETDGSWLCGAVRSLTGRTVVLDGRSSITERLRLRCVDTLAEVFIRDEWVAARDVDSIRRHLNGAQWPLKSPATDSTGTAKGNPACGCSGDLCSALSCAVHGENAEPVQPVAGTTYCRECGADCARGAEMPLCDAHAKRRAAASASVKRCTGCSSPAAPGSATCAYCCHRAPSLAQERPRERETAFETDKLDASKAARARLAALDSAEKPRETATSRELSRAHPWSNANEWEP